MPDESDIPPPSLEAPAAPEVDIHDPKLISDFQAAVDRGNASVMAGQEKAGKGKLVDVTPESEP